MAAVSRQIGILLFMVTGVGMAAPPLEAQDRDSPGRWSVSTSLTFPIVRIYQKAVEEGQGPPGRGLAVSG